MLKLPAVGKCIQYDDSGRAYKLGDAIYVRTASKLDFLTAPLRLQCIPEKYEPVTFDHLATAGMFLDPSDLRLGIDEASLSICRPLAMKLASEINEAWLPWETLVVGDFPALSMHGDAYLVKTGRLSLSLARAYDLATNRIVLRAFVLCGVTGGWSLIPKHERPGPIFAVPGISADALLAERFALQERLDLLMAA